MTGKEGMIIKEMTERELLEAIVREAGTSEVDLTVAARKNLNEALRASVIPEELWPEITAWIEETNIGNTFLQANECIGAWWAAREARSLGLAIHFIKSGILPSTWFPQGETWKEAEANAKLKLVESWERLVWAEALEKVAEE